MNTNFDQQVNMFSLKKNYGFIGEKIISIPNNILSEYLRNKDFVHSLYITRIGYIPNALHHYKENISGCSDYVLLYCLGGKGFIQINNARFELYSNQFIIIPPNSNFCYHADVIDPWTIYWVYFSSNKLKQLHNEFSMGRFYIPRQVGYNEDLTETWMEMYHTLTSGFCSENINYANFCLYRFLSFFLFPNKQVVNLGRKCPLDQSIDIMKKNLDKRLTVDDIAQQFDYSASHYTALFKQKTGMAPIDYFIRLKINFACQLLTDTDLKIKQVADRIGYDDPYYFSRLFKQITGRSPKEFKKIGRAVDIPVTQNSFA